jgi:phosphoglycerate dehydrogenase-like enzyme
MEIMLYQATYDRIKDRISASIPTISAVIMDDDGQLIRNGGFIEPGEAKPEVAFACSDLYSRGPSRDFMLFLLVSESVRWIQSGAAGFDHPVFKALVEKGIRLTNTNASAKTIAEFVVASVLCRLQPFTERFESQRRKEWNRIEFQELSSKKWLIIGLGNIGQEIAKRAAAFDCHITGVRRSPTGAEPADVMVLPRQIPDVLPDADVVVLSAALNDQTKQLVDQSFLRAMKPTSILVNIARGSLIDERALLESLDQGKPACAILDVFETEPLPSDSPFWTHSRVQVTAHCSAHSPEKRARGDAVFLDNLQRYIAGKNLDFEVSLSDFD